jgi:hypothetical protein
MLIFDSPGRFTTVGLLDKAAEPSTAVYDLR